MNVFKNFFIVLVSLVVLAGCGGAKQEEFRKDSKGNTVPTANYVGVAVDETFRPIFEILVNDFRDRNADAFTDVLFVPEDKAVKMLLNDTVRNLVVTRKLTQQEKDYLLAKFQLKPREGIVAFDAITLVTNPSNRDSLISVGELKQILAGKITDWRQLQHSNGQSGEIEVVFDNNGSSTVRYMQDSLTTDRNLHGKLRAATSNEELIKYVSQKKNAIGVIGVDWVGNPQDSTRLSFVNTVNIMRVGAKESNDEGDYYKPFQFYIASGSYPLVRYLYMISTDPRRRSLENDFYHYITDNPNHNFVGQMLILKKSQLLPYMAVQSRNVVITQY